MVEIAPLIRRITQDRTIRLVTTARMRASVLLKLVPQDKVTELAEIEGATSGRLKAQQAGSERLDSRELVFGIPNAVFINAAFVYWLPRQLNRFNGPGRGAWYSALHRTTSIAEVAFHMERELANVSDFNATVDYAELFASFIGEFVDLRELAPPPDFLNPDGAKGYGPGNAFAEVVRAAGSYGIVYPSVRHLGGTCFVALTPHAVQSVAQGAVIQLKWTGQPGPAVTELTS